MEMPRLSDTKALSSKGIRGGDTSCPDAGRAITARMAIPGALQYSYGAEGLDLVPVPPRGGVGGEGLRGAVMILTEGQIPRRKR